MQQRRGLQRLSKLLIDLSASPGFRRAELPPLTASLVRVVRAAEPRDGAMGEIVKQSRREYGSNLLGFASKYVGPALAALRRVSQSEIG